MLSKHDDSRAGVFYPSVTEIINYFLPTTFYCTDEQLENARREGIANHHLIENYFEMNDTFDIPYLIMFDKWYSETGLLKPHPEERIEDHDRCFSGKPDMFFLNDNTIIDLKRTIGDPDKHALQLAAYSLLIEKKYDVICDRLWIIQVMKTKVKVLDLSDRFESARRNFIDMLERFHNENRNA